MIKLSIALAIIGLALLLLSALPVPRQYLPRRRRRPRQRRLLAPGAAFAGRDRLRQGAVFGQRVRHLPPIMPQFPGSGFGLKAIFPDLTTYRWSADYLRTWLKDPAAVKPGTDMPNLGLKRDEIEALIAFLSAGK